MYWDEKIIEKIFTTHIHKNFKTIYKTNFGRFYFYFKKDNENEITGRVVFFPSSY